MNKLNYPDYIFLQEMAMKLEEGENLERSLFSIDSIPEENLVKLQLGGDFIDVISNIEFDYPALINLFSSMRNSNTIEVLEKIKITADLIKMREEVLKEKENTLNVHGRRLKIIRYVTLVTIAIIAGFSPLFSNLFSFFNTGEISNSLPFWSILSVSFLIINILNNYFLLKMSNEKKISIRLIFVIFIHLITVIVVRIFISNFTILDYYN
ncbi:MAG: hypothetical protein ACFFDS_01840 [Candidatus Thorarchaeota archaeon]